MAAHLPLSRKDLAMKLEATSLQEATALQPGSCGPTAGRIGNRT